MINKVVIKNVNKNLKASIENRVEFHEELIEDLINACMTDDEERKNFLSEHITFLINEDLKEITTLAVIESFDFLEMKGFLNEKSK